MQCPAERLENVAVGRPARAPVPLTGPTSSVGERLHVDRRRRRRRRSRTGTAAPRDGAADAELEDGSIVFSAPPSASSTTPVRTRRHGRRPPPRRAPRAPRRRRPRRGSRCPAGVPSVDDLVAVGTVVVHAGRGDRARRGAARRRAGRRRGSASPPRASCGCALDLVVPALVRRLAGEVQHGVAAGERGRGGGLGSDPSRAPRRRGAPRPLGRAGEHGDLVAPGLERGHHPGPIVRSHPSPSPSCAASSSPPSPGRYGSGRGARWASSERR